MQPVRISENIVPVSEFKAKAAEWLRRIAGRASPLVITQNGKAAAVIMSPAEYDSLTERARFLEAVEEGLTDVAAGRVTPHKEVVAELRRRFGGDDDE